MSSAWKTKLNTEVYDLRNEYDKALDRAAGVISTGGLVVMPTETVYGLAANARDVNAVRGIFLVKGRPQDNPLIVHIADMEELSGIAVDLSDMAKKALRAFWPGPFTAVLKKHESIPLEVTAGLNTVAVRMPALKAARDLIKRSGCPIAAPSANTSGKPSPTCAKHVIDDLMGKVPVILDGGSSEYGVESTVCDLTGDVPVVLRPGGVTAEMIEKELGAVTVAGAVLDGLKPDEKALSPGMKYKHYSPAAKVVVVDGKDTNTIAFTIKNRYDIEESMGRTPLILCLDEHTPLYEGRRVRGMGKNQSDAAAKLFYELREADELGADIIYFEAVKTEGMGLAVMNRVLRAAGFDVIYS